MLKNLIADWWSCACENKATNRDYDLIVPVSYGSFTSRLTKGSATSFNLALRRLKENTKECVFCYCAFRHSQGDCEIKFKKKPIIDQQVNTASINFCGQASSTIKEAEQVCACFEKMDSVPKKILVITGQFHSRSARLVWEKIFPYSQVTVEAFPYWEEIEPGQPMILMRNYWTWLLVNIIRHIGLRIFGLKIMRLFKQPT